ncbi:PIN domain-containing protein [Pseudomonas syringae pv. theae]|uniref:PIN domain-containing protein n=1 Tax=Pseudomonas syringae TaxID=317 RepID=UPI0023C001A4|nr:PIN domain-containing protein [Pseudomonas syringae]GKS08971.1 PIN domain-containing protein [Pseudomonas syringae pv. theae]
MTKLFVDTNIYLDFYRGAHDRLSLFEELKKLKDNLIISEQGYREFQRNRMSQLLKLAAEIERTSSISIFTTAVVRDMVEHQEATRLQSEVHKLGRELKSKINAMLEPKPGDDPVLDAYENLTKNCTFIKTKEELITKAKTRKILGNPPISPNRHSVCDELLWEELLEYCDEDLIVVSKDKTFTDNKKILRDEFACINPGKNLTIVKSVSDALRFLGAVSDRLEVTEAEMDFNVKKKPSRIANSIMEIAIRKSSKIISKVEDEFLSLTIKNVTLGQRSPDNYLTDAVDELMKMKLIADVGNGIYELTEEGRAYEPFD